MVQVAIDTPDWICPSTGKVIYETRGAARTALREIKRRPRRKKTLRGSPSTHLQAFKCGYRVSDGQHFHLGNARW